MSLQSSPQPNCIGILDSMTLFSKKHFEEGNNSIVEGLNFFQGGLNGMQALTVCQDLVLVVGVEVVGAVVLNGLAKSLDVKCTDQGGFYGEQTGLLAEFGEVAFGPLGIESGPVFRKGSV
jgi:hypothetical protein